MAGCEIALDTTSAYVATDFVDVRYALPEAIPFTPLKEKESLRTQIVNYALQFVGNRYVWGGNDPHSGVDCSGFTKYVYSHVAGVSLPRVSREQARTGTKIDSSKMRPGDLIFYTQSQGNGQPCGDVHWQWSDRPCGEPEKRHQDFYLELPESVPDCQYAGRLIGRG